jgi:hypothetical protein
MRRLGVAAALLFAVAVSAAAPRVHLMVITGVEGDEEHGNQFHSWATALIDAAKKSGPLDERNIVCLADRPARDPSRIAMRSTRENVEKAFTDLASRVQPDDDVVVVLIGHGSFDGQQASFNLPGPDLSASDYNRLLSKVRARRIAFVNTASSSGAFLEPMKAAGRSVVTATRTGGERNEPRFPAYFIEAFTSDEADRNRDGRVSILEAFEYARSKVLQAYEQAGLILTEHAALEDGTNGNLAAMMFLAPDRAAVDPASIANPVLRALLEERQALELRIDGLKLRKSSMDAGAYQQELEQLLTELARKTRAIQEAQGGK